MACEFNLNFLKEPEREAVLKVLYRDQMVRKTEEERVRKLKMQLHQLRWKGARNGSHEYQERSCARCQKSLGLLINRVVIEEVHFLENADSNVFCLFSRDVKVKAGEWFFEERAKKYPDEGRHETAGAKLLKSYQKLSKISVVPPTPPPYSESTAESNVKQKPQNELLNLLQKKSTPSLQELFYGAQDDGAILTKRNSKQEDDITTSPTSDAVFCDGRKYGSLYSLNSTCTESGNFGKANVTGEIEFAIRYIFKTCILEIHIRGCKNLAYGEEKKKKCNPYVKVYLLPDKSSRSKRKTAVRKSTVNPEFNETLKYKIECSQLGSRQLQISVWHAGALKYRVFLGEVVIPLAAWSFEDSSMESFNWYQLTSKWHLMLSTGLIFNVITFPVSGKKDQGFSNCQLQVMISGARNLPVLRSGMPNSFVKGSLILSDQAELKQKTPVVKKEDCPQWKHLFVFDVTPAQLQQSCLHLTVWDQSTFGSHAQFLGGAKLGAKQSLDFTDPISPSVLQWQEMFLRPNTWMDFTLILHSNMENFKS
ncbi:UNVERIFIED_CONTAM: hypothetical protein H355_013075 [Colinus virginianus]|nr:hypothetical protein H355_013075 [Colinus virginianus]